MLSIERILCPVDFSEFSARAFDYAQSLARRYEAELYLEHVIQPLSSAYPYYALPESFGQARGELRSNAQDHLRKFVKDHSRNGIKTEEFVEEGVVTDSILSLATQKSVDLIVMGTHGWRGIDRLLLGSVTETVLRKATCPVLAVRRPAHDFVTPGSVDEPVQLRKIIFCTDFSEHSERALEYALSLAMEYNSELTLLHILDDVPASVDLQKPITDIIHRLETPLPTEAQNWCRVKPTVRIGTPYQEIIQLALESQCDLVVMGVRGRSAIDLALFGSTTHRVIQLGSCPVLAVRY